MKDKHNRPIAPPRPRRPSVIMVQDPSMPYGAPPAPKRRGPGFLNLSILAQVWIGLFGTAITTIIMVMIMRTTP